MRLRTAHDRLKIEHSIIDGVRGILEDLLKATPAIRSVIPVGAMDDQELRVMTLRGGRVDCRVPTLCRFVPLRGGEGWQ